MLLKILKFRIKQTRYLIEFAGFMGAVALFRLLGVQRASRVAGKLAQWIGPLLPVHRVGMKNLIQVFPDWSADRRKDVLKKMWFHWGAVCGEYCHLGAFSLKKIQIEGKEGISSFQGRPCIFVSGHFGNFQMISLALKQCGFKVTQVYRQANNPWVDKVMQRFQSQTCHRVVSKEDHSVKAIVQALQSNQAIVILVDQKFSQGPLLPFLGHLAYTTVVPARCAEKYRCPLIPVCAQRLKDGGFKVKFFPPIFYKNSPKETMHCVNQYLEEWVKKHPEQWFWIHKRWPFCYD
ncbi:lysophospholipid acyltransferase family protein [Holospora undulata]|uniref:Lipid A biosynthesis (KDO)2-(Lauroyl)-lipid IVA acyltransferase n=1 Tax=Holospora undulata HU1 TaxID=1321371 RepID=A0A061JIS6_9PROT|nr:lysophospholipid acyltransferase family protein [Holospora undulata]ETZ05079.1 lipid A biosynthesis (KDO)2-(lauroyl)-lipid IVA acyltransferase [Holospora undulata HU1]